MPSAAREAERAEETLEWALLASLVVMKNSERGTPESRIALPPNSSLAVRGMIYKLLSVADIVGE